MSSKQEKTQNGYVVNTQFLDDDENMVAPPPPPASTDDQTANDDTNMNENKESESNLNSKKVSRMNEKGHFIKSKGISWPLCALFLIADMAGGGIVALPAAVQNTYFVPGVLVCIFVALISMYTCILLGECWVLLQKRHPKYRDFCRQVYSEIGNRAIGKWAKHFVSVTIDINQFGVSVIYLLLSAKSINDACNVLIGHSIHYCFIIGILALILLPATFLKSPEEFWWTIFGAMACSVLSVIFIMVGSALDFPKCKLSGDDILTTFKHINPIKTISGFGTIVFSFGGHSSFPVILHDMKKPADFTKSSYLAFGGISLLYIPMSIFGFLTYGGNIKSSIINSIQTVWVQQAVNLMIMLHCITAFLLVLNPLNQDIEERFKAPHHFCWQRVVIRTSILAAITFVGLTIPNFGPILDLIGASATLLTVLIFPVIFYFYLNAAGKMRDEKMEKSQTKEESKMTEVEPVEEYPRPTFKQMLKYNDKRHLVFGFGVMLFGIIICACSSGTAIFDISNTSFELPCYVKLFQNASPPAVKPLMCCGINGNIAAQGNNTCTITERFSFDKS